MFDKEAQAVAIIGAQYHAMFDTLLWFEHQAGQYLDANLGVQADVEHFYDILPTSGAVLCVFRKFPLEELSELMTHVVVDGRRGTNHLDLAHLTDEEWVPSGPHLLTDVRDGRGRSNIGLYNNRRNIAREGRKGFAAIHLVLWGLFHGNDALTHHFINGIASKYRISRVPSLRLWDGTPMLDSSFGDECDPMWGTPCAGNVLVP